MNCEYIGVDESILYNYCDVIRNYIKNSQITSLANNIENTPCKFGGTVNIINALNNMGESGSANGSLAVLKTLANTLSEIAAHVAYINQRYEEYKKCQSKIDYYKNPSNYININAGQYKTITLLGKEITVPLPPNMQPNMQQINYYLNAQLTIKKQIMNEAEKINSKVA